MHEGGFEVKYFMKFRGLIIVLGSGLHPLTKIIWIIQKQLLEEVWKLLKLRYFWTLKPEG